MVSARRTRKRTRPNQAPNARGSHARRASGHLFHGTARSSQATSHFLSFRTHLALQVHKMASTPEAKYDLITRRLQETLGGEAIKAILDEGKRPVKCYWGRPALRLSKKRALITFPTGTAPTGRRMSMDLLLDLISYDRSFV